MKHRKEMTVKERRAADARKYRIALGISALVHLFVFFVWKSVPIPPSPFAAAGPRAGDLRAAGGGMQSLNLQAIPPSPIIPPRVPVISLEISEPVEFDFEPAIDLSALAGEAPGRLEGPPGIGEGRGDGGTGTEGLLRVVPPSPRGLIIPPTNRGLRGKQVEVWVFVDAAGKVVADSTRLNPPTSDRSFNRRLMEEAAEWVFNPATKSGEPVAAWYPYTVSISDLSSPGAKPGL
jgi:hypothetical protein